MRRVNKANGATIDFLWAYDALRNRKRLGELQGPWPRNFVYDAFGRLVHIGIPFGPYTDLYQDGPDTALMHSGVRSDQPTWTRFVHGPGDDQVLAMEVYAPNAEPTPGTGQQFYFHADGEGSIRLVTDSTGNIANRYDYDSFGRRIAVTESVQQPYGWKGRDFIAGPDIYYNRARFYDPVLGKFIAEDPLGFASGDTNLYAFAWSNPRNWKDPSGLSSADTGSVYANAARIGAGAAAVGCAASLSLSVTAAKLGTPDGYELVGFSSGGLCVVKGNYARIVYPPRSQETSPGTPTGDHEPGGECWSRNMKVQAWKIVAGALGKCSRGMTAAALSVREQAWRSLAVARASNDEVCWAGGNEGHQKQQAQNWENAGECSRLLAGR